MNLILQSKSDPDEELKMKKANMTSKMCFQELKVASNFKEHCNPTATNVLKQKSS